MGIFNFNPFNRKSEAKRAAMETPVSMPVSEKQMPQAQALYYPTNGYNNVYVVSYNGEKNLGEAGPIKKLMLDHEALRLRSWQLYLESEIAQTVFNRFTKWIIGSGLKIETEPVIDVLISEGIKLDPKAFKKPVESRFKVFANSRNSDYAKQKSLNKLARTAYLNAIVGGDVLIVQRYVNEVLTIQLIDGSNVCTPFNLNFVGADYIAENGNRVRHGVELSETGEHIAYYVRVANDLLKYERIPARGEKSGELMAFLVYGLEYRLDNVRGIPLISAVMETMKKMDRYKEATLGSAEERQKVPFAIEHGVESDGENPFTKQLAKARNPDNIGDIPVDNQYKALADTVAATTNKQVVNMPVGAKLVSLEAKNELYFKDFYTIHIDLVCATIGIPPEVAMSKYESNFSSSRAALKDWEHTILVCRKDFTDQYYQPIYNLWLNIQVLTGKVVAPGYIKAMQVHNVMALDAYRTIRATGANVPHIDPLKEVNAERAKLGPLAAHLPLTTLEAATEALNGGEYSANISQMADEIEEGETAGLEPVVPGVETDEPETDKEDKSEAA